MTSSAGYTSAHGHSTLDPSPTIVSHLVPNSCKPFDRHGQEDLTSEHGYSDAEEDDEMGDLSDSPSSHTSHSRPTTPSGVHAAPRIRTRASSSPPASDLPFTLAHKAERILGLIPGTLPYARAALDNARVEVRLTGETDTATPFVPPSGISGSPNGSGMKGRMDRAKKAMSVVLPGTKVANVVVGAGGKEEERRRERRRRAADGVIYWQNEVARLEREEREVVEPTARKRR